MAEGGMWSAQHTLNNPLDVDGWCIKFWPVWLEHVWNISVRCEITARDYSSLSVLHLQLRLKEITVASTLAYLKYSNDNTGLPHRGKVTKIGCLLF